MPRIVESLKTNGVFSGLLEAEDIIRILQSYAGSNTEDAVLKLYATIAEQDINAEAVPDASLKFRIENALEALTQQNKKNALFLIEYADHFYLGVAKLNDHDSVTLKIHDIRGTDTSDEKTNQTLVANIFEKTAGEVAQEQSDITLYTDFETKKDGDVEWNGQNCGDLVIVRGLQEIGFEFFTDNSEFSEIKDATQLRQLVIKEAIDAENLANTHDDADSISEDDSEDKDTPNVDFQNIEFISTKDGLAALNKSHKDYHQNKDRLTHQRPRLSSRASEQSSYSWLQLYFRQDDCLKNDKKKQDIFVNANKAMEEILDNPNIKDKFEEKFNQMVKAVNEGKPEEIEIIKTSFSN